MPPKIIKLTLLPPPTVIQIGMYVIYICVYVYVCVCVFMCPVTLLAIWIYWESLLGTQIISSIGVPL